MKTLLLSFLFITSFFVRSLRWLGIVQQKEYRFDRLFLFLRSNEGITELLRFLPKKADFSRMGLKRPKLTARSGIIFLTYVLGSIFYFIVFLQTGRNFLLLLYPYPKWYLLVLSVITLLIYLVCIPLIALLSVVPTALIAYLQTLYKLFLAKRKLEKFKPHVIGITGSYGKTSTKILLAHVLKQKYSVFKTPRSFNTKYSVAQSVVSGFTGQEIAIIEYGAYKVGEIRAITKWIKPTFAVVTGLTEQHLGLFGDISKIILAKSELVASLPKKSKVVCNIYDERTLQICEIGSKNNNAELIKVSEKSKKPTLENIRLNSEGKLQFYWKGKTIFTQLLGLQYQELIKTVIVTAQAFNLSEEEISIALETFVPNEKFIVSYNLSTETKVIDDGDTSNPKGFSAVIKLAKKVQSKRKILFTPGIVDLGKRSREIHLELAREAKKVFDLVIFVGESGKQEFQTVFLEDLLDSEKQLKEVIETSTENDLFIIEGRMPAWVTKYLQ